MEQEIIQPIDKEVLKRELTPELQLRMTMGACARLPSVKQVAVRAKLWISMNSIPVRIAINN